MGTWRKAGVKVKQEKNFAALSHNSFVWTTYLASCSSKLVSSMKLRFTFLTSSNLGQLSPGVEVL